MNMLLIEHAKEKFGLPADWEASSIRAGSPEGSGNCPPNAFQITGAVYQRYLRGPKKGRLMFDKKPVGHLCAVAITKAEHDAYLVAWEIRTGKCYRCCGTGEVVTGWSRAEGKHAAGQGLALGFHFDGARLRMQEPRNVVPCPRCHGKGSCYYD